MVVGFYQKLLDSIKNSKKDAYIYYGSTHTYSELYDVIKKVFEFLDGRRNENVILYSSKSFAAYGAIYGILFSGNTWIPITPDAPVGRNIEIFRMTDAKLIFVDTEVPEPFLKLAKEKGAAVVKLEDLINKFKGVEIELPEYYEKDIAYIMFTSGSTGIPKGVPMTHENYINFVNNCIEILPFHDNEVFSDYHDYAFDISIFYLFCCPLVQGAFAPVRTQEDVVLPLRFIAENKVTVWSSVPSVISRIQSFRPDEKIDTFIRIMFLCGEPFSLKVLKYCIENMSVEHVYNFYGLTETGVENFYHECLPEDIERYRRFGYVPIGKPLNGNDVDVTSDNELLLSGVQVTPGYLADVGSDKFETINKKRWFHTGDIVERQGDVYFCKGRKDSQVKLGGYRVELMDIEANIRLFNGVDDVVCFIIERKNRKVLNAAIKPKTNFSLDVDVLKAFIIENLPDYMVPSKFFILDRMPTNKNGKIDRRYIKEMYDINEQD